MQIVPRNIRTELQNSINEINANINYYEDTVNRFELYKAVTGMFETKDIDELIQATLSFTAIYRHLTSDAEAKEKSEKMLECLYYVKNVERKELQDVYDTKKKVDTFNKIIKGFIGKKNEYQTIVENQRESINAQRSLRKQYIFIKSKLDHKGLLTEEDVSFLEGYMEEKGYDVEQKILALEYIRIHNLKIEYPDSRIITQVRDMLYAHYHDLKMSHEENMLGVKYQSTIFSYQTALEDLSDVQEIINILSESQKDFGSENDFFAVLKHLVNRFGQKLNEDIQDLKENYKDITLRKVILETYNDHMRRYIPLKKLYYEKLKIANQKDTGKKIVDELYYSGTGSSYMEKDLKDIPNEKLLEVKDLLERKKYHELKPDEDSALHNNDKLIGLRELRGDQVRICYRHLGENRYVIVGVFLKKSDNLIYEYEAMASRKVTNDLSSTEKRIEEWIKAQETEGRIYEYIDNNYRIGSR